MYRYKLVIEYMGTNYHGWQRQKALTSIQEEIEKAIESFCGEFRTLHCSGRTDAGVHALAQVAHVDLPQEYQAYKVRDAINFYLKPQPITILKVEAVESAFHARFSTKQRSYLYRIVNRYAHLTMHQNRAWHVPKKLDVEAMHDAAQILVGHHDFTTFRASLCQSPSPVKTLEKLIVKEKGTDIIEIFTTSRSFLHHQVRNMVGSLKLVGEGRWTKEDIKNALEARDRTKGGPTAPPDGLYLYEIRY